MKVAVKNIPIDKLKEIFNNIEYVKIAILFGSRATKKYNSFSDYDIAILANNKDAWEFGGYWIDISNRLKISDKSLDLIDLKRVTPLLAKSIKEVFIVLKGSEDEFYRLLSINKK